MPAQAEQVLFEEEQSFRQVWVWALMGGNLVLLVAVLVLILVRPPAKDGVVPAVIGLSIGVLVGLGVPIFMYVFRLGVRVDATGLHVRFFPLLSKHFPLDEISHWEARTYRPLLEYGGWGIRCGWKGMAYNVSGNRGVQLVFTNGKRLLIGSQRPQELADAIGRAKQENPHGLG
jgi:hypothetical protein